MRSPNSAAAPAPLSVGQAVALGAIHGPAELLPVSSSAHTGVLPWLLGWDYQELAHEERKSFEVALHAGTMSALLVIDGFGWILGRSRAHELQLLALASAPAALAGVALERPIERHLGTPPTIAFCLVAGAALLAISDRAPERRASREAGSLDALWLGVAQAVALIPGVSRSGATLAAARLLGFTRADAALLSRQVGVPVIAGATLLKGIRLRRGGLPEAASPPFIAGAAAAFASTIAAGRFVRAPRLLWPFATYRVALAAAILVRRRRSAGSRRMS
jgi:undecaprenyl-diphosphatase